MKRLADWQVSAILSDLDPDGCFCGVLLPRGQGLKVNRRQHEEILFACWGGRHTPESALAALEREGLA